ncbi:MAG: pyridoxal phosphate-dependent aminotransferase [Nanobdellota archaeon]
MKELNRTLESIDMSPIRKVFDKAATLANPINLSIGIPHVDSPDALKTAVCEAVNTGSNAYTPTKGMPALIERVKSLGTEKGIHGHEAIITAGAAGALDLALRCMLNPGDEVIVPDPYFVAYTAIPPLCGARVRLLDTYPDFRIREKALRSLVTAQTKAIIINTPHNPTGRVYDASEIAIVARIAREHDLFVVSDEVYEDYIYAGEHYAIGAQYENTITIGSFSKSHAVTGWRVGYALGPPGIIEEMCKLQQFTYVCANSAAQKALAQVDASAGSLYAANRALLAGLSYDFVMPEGAFYAFLPVPAGFDDASFADAALERNLLLVPGSAFSSRNSHVRISFATDSTTLEKGIIILNELRQSR